MTTTLLAGWKPISSAPKDGTPVLLFARHVDATASTRVVGSFDNNGFGWIAQCYVGQPFARLVPSHWMDLPAFPDAPNPPASAQDDAKDERTAFESWMRSQGLGTERHGDSYSLTYARRAWDAWQARASVAAPAAGDARDAARYRRLRDHACNSLHLTRDGDHACNYLSAAEWIDSCPEDFQDDTPEEIARMKAANTIWRLQVYPNTPIGFWALHGSTLDAVVDASIAASQQQEG